MSISPQSTFWKTAKSVWDQLKKYGIRLTTAAVIGLILLKFFGGTGLLPQDVKDMVSSPGFPAIAYLSVFIWLLFELVYKLESTVDAKTSELDEKIKHIPEQVVLLTEWHGEQYNLVDCVRYCREELQNVTRWNEVTIDHIGLDMLVAWERVRDDLLANINSAARIKYRLLMITSDSDELLKKAGESANPIRGMLCDNARRSLDSIKSDIESFKSRISGIEICIKMYAEIPFVHGFSLHHDQRSHHVAFARWRGEQSQQFTWGDGHYFRIVGASPKSALGDLAVIFDSYFDHLWLNSKVVHQIKHPPDSVTSAPPSKATGKPKSARHFEDSIDARSVSSPKSTSEGSSRDAKNIDAPP